MTAQRKETMRGDGDDARRFGRALIGADFADVARATTHPPLPIYPLRETFAMNTHDQNAVIAALLVRTGTIRIADLIAVIAELDPARAVAEANAIITAGSDAYDLLLPDVDALRKPGGAS